MATSTQNVTNVTSNIGAAQLPYYNAAMQRAQGLLTAPTPLYDRDRLEGFTAQQKKLQGEVAGLQTPGQFGTATNMANQAGVAALNAGNYNPAAQYNPTQFTTQQIQDQSLNYHQMDDAEKFGNAQAKQYMSPYVQNVLDIQKREAQEDAQRTQLMQNLGASRQGTYGGSRQLLAGLTRERDLGQQMGDIQAKGMQDAYENAQMQFERDRAAGFSVKDANLRAKLSVQEAEAKNNLQARMANQQYDMERQKAGEQSRQYGANFNEQSRQFGASQGLAGAQAAGQMAQTLNNIGQTQQNADAQRLGMQQSTAAQEQALNQQMRDLDYADFQKEANDPYTRLQQYMGLMSGVPQNMTTTTTSSAPSPGLAQQLAGAGLGAYSTYKMFSGG